MLTGMTTSLDEHTDNDIADSWLTTSGDNLSEDGADGRDLDESSGTDEADAIAPGVPSDEKSAPKTPVKKRAKSSELDRAAVRKVIAKFEEISAATDTEREVLSIIFGCQNDTSKIATEAICTPRVATTTIHDLISLADADPMEAGLTVISWESDKRSEAWALLSGIGAAAGSLSTNAPKAAKAVASAALKLTDPQRSTLLSAVSIARK